MTLAAEPASYTGVERDDAAARGVTERLGGPARQCLVRPAHDTGLPAASTTVVYAEAMMTMATDDVKHRIVAEAYRLLAPGGRFGLHELLLTPDALPEADKATLAREVSRSIRVGARPLTAAEWRRLLEAEGFEVTFEARAPMGLLDPAAFVRDEGVSGTARFLFNLLRRRAALRRVGNMWMTFRRHRRHLAAISLVAVKPAR